MGSVVNLSTIRTLLARFTCQFYEVLTPQLLTDHRAGKRQCRDAWAIREEGESAQRPDNAIDVRYIGAKVAEDSIFVVKGTVDYEIKILAIHALLAGST